MKNIYIKLIILLISLSQIACEGTKEEGCLDAAATNFSFSADEACGGCCTYPSLIVEFAHKVKVADKLENFVLGSAYLNNLGNTFAVKDMRFYISDLRLLRANGTWESVSDTISLTLQNGAKALLTDDFILVTRGQTVYNIGKLQATGTFTGLSFLVGLTGQAADVDATAVTPTEHPLAKQTTEAMFDVTNKKYIFNKIKMIPNVSNSDIIKTYEVKDSDKAVRVVLQEPFSLKAGYDSKFSIAINYSNFFDNINFNNDDAETIVDKIVSNTPSAFQ